MRELPILFKTEMVQAIQSGRKTQTRRTRGLEKINQNPEDWEYAGRYIVLNGTNNYVFGFINNITKEEVLIKPRYQVGDHLWAKETFTNDLATGIKYKADNPKCATKWKSSLFMPKSAARLWLEVTNVRCQRVQSISEIDAMAEGLEMIEPKLYKNYFDSKDEGYIDPRYSFASLWAKVNGMGSWQKNVWVFAYDFKIISNT